MEIRDQRKSEQIEFKYIIPGNVFTVKGCVYVKIESPIYCHLYNAVNLTTNEICHFADNETIKFIKNAVLTLS